MEVTLVAGQTQVPAHLLPPSTGWGWAVLVTVVAQAVGAQHGATEGEGPSHCDGPGRGVVRGSPARVVTATSSRLPGHPAGVCA